MAEELMLTTEDNPYNPLTEWDEWYAYDAAYGYNTPGLLARFVVSSDALSDADQEDAIDEAMRYIVEEKVYGPYKLVGMPAKDSD